MSVTVAARNTCLNTGEGPHWDATRELLYYVDIDAFNINTPGKVHVYNPATGEDKALQIDQKGPVSFVIPRTKGGYVVGHNHNISNLDIETGKITEVLATVHDLEKDKKDTRFNDGKCDASGRLWAGTFGGRPLEDFDLGTFYSIDASHQVTERVSPVNISNGLAFTEDKKTLYYNHSVPRKIFGFDLDITTGDIANQRVVIDFGGPETMPERGIPDGMSIDTNGNLWIACYGAGRVIQFDPRTGKELRHVEIPGAKQITSCCFGGKNLDELYVTSAKHKGTATDTTTLDTQPLAGSLFKVTGLGVKGYCMPNYAG